MSKEHCIGTEIGRGAQYRVIDIGGDRVRKIPLSPLESRAVVESWYPPEQTPPEVLALDYAGLAASGLRQVRSVLSQFHWLSGSLGNPKFEEEGVYTQDKVTMLGTALKESTITEGRSLIDEYVELILKHWRYGMAEQTFNCTVNNGVDAKGKVILVDFGEVTFDKQEASNSVTTRGWLRSMSYRRDIPPPLRGYYSLRLGSELRSGVLTGHWKIRPNI